jgi:hypothetical protein
VSIEKFKTLIDEFHVLAERLRTSSTRSERRLLLAEMNIVSDKLELVARDKKSS